MLGRIRSTQEVTAEVENQSTVISLSVFPPQYPTVIGDDRYTYNIL
jgi:hypothetical protein